MAALPVVLAGTTLSTTYSEPILYSSCTSHVINEKSNFETTFPHRGEIQVGNDEFIEAKGVGAVEVETIVDSKKHNIVLQDVLYAPKFLYNLISLPQAAQKHFLIPADHKNDLK